MNNKENIDLSLLWILWVDGEYKVYYSNIWFIIVSEKKDFVYKIFDEEGIYNKEINVYNLLQTENIKTPLFEWLWRLKDKFVLKLENIRRDYERKNDLSALNLAQIAEIISKIHKIKEYWKNLILWDIHSSNFYEINSWEEIKLGIFDFSSSKYWEIEEDIANIYIDLWIDRKLLKTFIDNYDLEINMEKLYKYTIKELYERIKNWMNLEIKKRKMYYTYIIKLKERYENKRI